MGTSLYPCRGGCPHPPAVGRHPPVGAILAAARPYRGGAPGRRALQAAEIFGAGGPGVPPLRVERNDRIIGTVPLIRSSVRTGPPSPRGKLFCTGSVGSSKPGAQREPHQPKFLQTQGPSGPGRNRTQALLILRAGNEAPTKQEGVPRNGVRGKATMGTKCPSEPSPAAFWLLCRRGQSNPLSADSGTPSAKIYGPLITLGLQNHFHSRQPK